MYQYIRNIVFLIIIISPQFSLSVNDSISFESLILKRAINIDHSDLFSEILIQDNEGRIKPFHTVASEILRKISRKQKFYDQEPSQIVLGMTLDPLFWYMVPLIKVSDISTIIGTNDSHVSFLSFFDSSNTYLLSKYVESAYEKKPIDRSKFDKTIIDIDERVNICSMVFSDQLIKLFPSKVSTQDPWTIDVDMDIPNIDSSKTQSFKSIYRELVLYSIENQQWDDTNSLLNFISNHQYTYAQSILPSVRKIKLEILYNKLNPFGWSRLFAMYLLCGFTLLVLLFIDIFRSSKVISNLINFVKISTLMAFISHVLALVVRWYISGHAPWSNAYESVIFITFATMLAGFLFVKKSNFALAASCFVASMLLFVANLNWLNPEVTNLVPVLKSYWLMIHVSVITSSYGFFGLCAFIGFLNLILVILSSDNKIKTNVNTLSVINEQSMMLGLFLLTIGTFLGGVWANESWGRYWGWDPKETWALVSCVTYSLILHLRLLKLKKYLFVFNVCALFGFSSILMTYFGVNFYLDGLHSYAAGDAFPIPGFILPAFIVFMMISTLSFFRFNKWIDNE
jgi:cytochrome c-type biogenesis protein CcsB